MLWKLFFNFFKIGLFTFGGGYAMIAVVKETVVDKFGWLTEDEFMEVIAIAESTPGPIAINMATFVGYKKAGVAGSALATAGVVTPSLVIIFLISLFLEPFMANKYVAYAFVGIRCAVAFLILKAGFGLLSKAGKKPLPMITFGVLFITLLVLEWFAVSISAIVWILAGGAIGIYAYALREAKSSEKEGKK
ncbi:MAG: chromate transporter [Clostridia bacterium]|nr:chromate transporter [Clostridia bacterium]